MNDFPDHSLARELIARVPPAVVDRELLLQELPEILETALGCLMDAEDPKGFIRGCNILAATVARLKN